jgi:monovalent cation:H+ antiporter-2, CPA2 family
MSETVDLESYKETLLFLGTAGLVVPAFHRLKLSPIIGFILAGVALGPFGLGQLVSWLPFLQAVTITNVEQMAGVAEFGVVFLLFMIGLELSFERLSRMRRLVFGLGLLQVLVSAVALAGIAYALGTPAGAAIVIGAALSLSSTAVVIPVLAENKRLNTAAGRVCFAVLLFQDLAVAPLLFTTSILHGTGDENVGRRLLLALAPAAIALVALVILGRLVLRPLFHYIAAARSTELFVAGCLFVVIGTALVAALSGLSMPLGAFIAGLLLAETEFRREIEVTIEPFKGLLLGLFFVSVGADLDLSVVAQRPWLIVGLAIGLITSKALIVASLAWMFRLTAPVIGEVALLLGPGGEFAFVMISAGLAVRAIAEPSGQMLQVVVTLTMIAIPVLAALAARLVRRVPVAELPFEQPPEDDSERVIIVGFGRVGELVGDMLSRHNVSFVALDSDVRVVARQRAAGSLIYYGDPTKTELLRRCGIAKAKGLVVTMNDPKAVESVVAAARAERSDLTIIARARDATHARHLYELGVTDAVPETIEASLQLSEAVLVDIGVPMGFVIASIHEKRDEFRALLNVASGEMRERRAIRKPARARRERPASQ